MSKNDTEKPLDVIVEHLKHCDIKYTNANRDGRVNSAMHEVQILAKLRTLFNTDRYLIANGFDIKVPGIRDWYDFGIVNKDKPEYFVPVNIKVTRLSTDNLNCKLGIYFALTGLYPTELSNEINWEQLFCMLKQHINTFNDKDYYFLVANKADNTDFFWNSLKGLQSLVPNGNNLPFQTNWRQNRVRTPRTHDQAGYFILNCFKESVYKRAAIKELFDEYIEPCLRDYKNNMGNLA